MPEGLSRNLIKDSEQDLGKLAIHKEQCGRTAVKKPMNDKAWPDESGIKHSMILI